MYPTDCPTVRFLHVRRVVDKLWMWCSHERVHTCTTTSARRTQTDYCTLTRMSLGVCTYGFTLASSTDTVRLRFRLLCIRVHIHQNTQLTALV